MFTKEELEILFAVLAKTQLTGREAPTIALLMQKVEGLIRKEDNPEKAPKKEQK